MKQTSYINLHELIDREEPRCLYCNSEFDIHLGSSTFTHGTMRVDTETLTCRKCKELFRIMSAQDHVTANTTYDGTLFTCKELYIFDYYKGQTFWIGYDENHGRFNVSVPHFVIDFSDKEALYQKFKTYLIFS